MNNDKQGHFFNHYDLWINNNLLRQGLQLVLDSLSPGCFHGKYVFFTSDNYYAVLNHHYDRKSQPRTISPMRIPIARNTALR